MAFIIGHIRPNLRYWYCNCADSRALIVLFSGERKSEGPGRTRLTSYDIGLSFVVVSCSPSFQLHRKRARESVKSQRVRVESRVRSRILRAVLVVKDSLPEFRESFPSTRDPRP